MVETTKGMINTDNMTYIKTDKNGTEYYESIDHTCDRCGGRGVIDSYRYVDNGVCFQCGGSGRYDRVTKYKVFTEEYFDKLTAKRIAKQEADFAKKKAEAEKKNAEFFAKNGFDAEGNAYVVLGNTYEIKDELKEMGAKFKDTIKGWILPADTDKYPTMKINVEDLYYTDINGVYKWNTTKYDVTDVIDRIKAENNELTIKKNRETSDVEFFGTIGDKIEMLVTVKSIGGFESKSFNYYDATDYTYVYTFEDDENHVFVWKTKNYFEFEVGDTVTLKGKVKDHNEYRGINQTVVTRCKIA